MQKSNFIVPYINGAPDLPPHVADEEGGLALGTEPGCGFWCKSYCPDSTVIVQVTSSTETILALKADPEKLWIEDQLICPECGAVEWGELNVDGSSPTCAKCLAAREMEVLDAN